MKKMHVATPPLRTLKPRPNQSRGVDCGKGFMWAGLQGSLHFEAAGQHTSGVRDTEAIAIHCQGWGQGARRSPPPQRWGTPSGRCPPPFRLGRWIPTLRLSRAAGATPRPLSLAGVASGGARPTPRRQAPPARPPGGPPAAGPREAGGRRWAGGGHDGGPEAPARPGKRAEPSPAGMQT